MTLNLDKNRDVLISSWKDVLEENTATNWALYGYDGQTFDLNLVSKGDGGLEELADEFNSGKIQYALARVAIKEKNVVKIALINWQGEGAPLSRKGMCANHIGIVRTFFKGIHVTMNARTDEEIDPDLVTQTVAKAIAGEGVKMSQSTDTDTNIGPVGTCYKKTNPREEINSLAKDEFWRKEEMEEERRKRDEHNKLQRFSQNEVKLLRRESQDYFNDSSKPETPSVASASNNSKGTVGTGITPKINGSTTNGTDSSPPTLTNEMSVAAVKASTPMKSNTSSDLVRQRVKSFDMGQPDTPISNGINGKSIDNSNAEGDSLSVSRRRQLFENVAVTNVTNTVQRKVHTPTVQSKWAQPKADNVPTPGIVANFVQQGKLSPTNAILKSPLDENSSMKIEAMPEEKVVGCGGIQRSVSPKSPSYTAELPSVSPGNSMVPRPRDSPARSPVPPVSNSPVRGSPSPYSPPNAPSPQQQLGAPPGFEDSVEGQSLEQTDTITIEITPEMGLCARALYDYQAADETEITFDPGEIITNIERIDEGWWEGLGPRGVYGLFPANYVELLN